MNFSDILALGPMVADKPIHIRMVADEHCPHCGNAGRPKVCDLDGNWHWKCSTPNCDVGYYLPGTDYVELRPDLETAAAITERIRRELEEQMKDRVWITRGNCSKTIHKDEAIPAGWHLTGTEGTD